MALDDQILAVVNAIGAEIKALKRRRYRQVMTYNPGNGTTLGTNRGFLWNSTGGTVSHNTPSATDPIRRTLWAAAATAGSAAGVRMAHNPFFRQIGWDLVCTATWVPGASGQLQVGMTVGAALAGEPSATNNQIIVGYDSTDANLQLMWNDGTGVSNKQDLGIARTSPVVFRLEINCAANNNPIVSIRNAQTEAVILAPTTLTTKLMTLTQSLAFVCQCRNTVTTPPSVGLSLLEASTPY